MSRTPLRPSMFIVWLGVVVVAQALTPPEILKEMKPRVSAMIDHAFDHYARCAFPQDEIRPISGTGHDTLGAYALTLIDSLDLLAISGKHDQFRQYSRWVQDHVSFDVDKEVSVFETSIRILGGLLSAHFMYEEGIVSVVDEVDPYDGGLLRLAVDLGDRLLPAFRTPTGIPYGTVNLRKGVPRGEIDVTSTAGAGTFLLEMTVLSAVTGDLAFEVAARRATRSLFQHRVGATNLVGNHINITSGQWTLELASVGSGVDSFIEYLIKSYAFTGDPEMYHSYTVLREAFAAYTRKGPWYIESSLMGQTANALHNSLAAFYPGNIVFSGRDVNEAIEACFATHYIMKSMGGIPEGFDVLRSSAHTGQLGYPLRPEHAESIYMLYRLTNDSVYLEMGKEFALMLWTRTATQYGYAALTDCTLPHSEAKYSDSMESFVLAETLKYLYLLFDDSNDLHHQTEESLPVTWVFNTEGHPLPVKEEWRWWRLYEERKRATAELKTELSRDPPECESMSADSRSSWRSTLQGHKANLDTLYATYGNEYAPWNEFTGHTCPCGDYVCLMMSPTSEGPTASARPHRSVELFRLSTGGFRHRVIDEVPIMDRTLRCTGSQPASEFDRLSHSLFHRTFDVQSSFA